ncbi:MAG: YIP1 family protein [bacterium]|nr:YIP1 family protein [bacterium]
MDFDAIIKRVINIITKPNDEWEKIKDESKSINDMFTGYAMILAAIPAVAGFIGWIAIGKAVPFYGMSRLPFGRGLLFLIMTYAVSLGSVYLMAFIIDALSSSFNASKNLPESMKVAIYSSTPAWVAGVFNLVPVLAIIAMVAGFYSLYLLYLGIKKVKNPPADKATGYFVVVIIAQIIVAFVIAAIVSSVVFVGGAGFMF